MKKVFPILLILSVSTLCACRQKESLTANSERHADGVATLRSLAARELTRETETTVVTMRPDTTGNLVEVARDVVRTVTREAENATQGDTTTFHAETMQNTTEEKKQGETRRKETGTAPIAFVAGAVSASMLIVSGVAAILYAKWKSRL